MIVLVAAENENAMYGGSGRGMGYASSLMGVGDEIEEWRRMAVGNYAAASRIGGMGGSRASSRSRPGSRNGSESGGELDGGFGLRKRGDRERILEMRRKEKMRGTGHDELYAEYLREQGRRGSSVTQNDEDKTNVNGNLNGVGSPTRTGLAKGVARPTRIGRAYVVGSPTRTEILSGGERPYMAINGIGTPNGSVRMKHSSPVSHLSRPQKATAVDGEVSPM